MQEVSGSIPLTSTKSKKCFSSRSPSSRGLGHHPFTVSTGVRIPLGTPGFDAAPALRQSSEAVPDRFLSPSSRGLGHHPFTVSTGVRIPLGTPAIAKSRLVRLFAFQELTIRRAG